MNKQWFEIGPKYYIRTVPQYKKWKHIVFYDTVSSSFLMSITVSRAGNWAKLSYFALNEKGKPAFAVVQCDLQNLGEAIKIAKKQNNDFKGVNAVFEKI